MNNFGKNLALWIVIGLLLVALFNLFQTSSSRGPQSTLAFSDFVADVNRGQVTDVTIQGNSIIGHFTDGRAFSTYAYGPAWLGAIPGANERIQEEADPVRVEVETALRRRVPVIPVLIGNTRMPSSEELPPSLKKSSSRVTGPTGGFSFTRKPRSRRRSAPGLRDRSAGRALPSRV